MAEKVEIEIDVKSNAAGSIKELKELKRQLKEAAAGSAEFKRLANEIDDLEDKIKGSKQAAGDWVDQLASAPGPLGAIGSALNKAKVATVSWGAALKATGIGLIVAAIGGLVAAISQSEEATKKFQPILIGLQRIFNGVYRALEPVIDGVLTLATQAMPYVTQAFGVAYSAISSFLQGLGKLGSAIGKLIKGDFTGAWEDAKASVTEFGKRYDEANKNFVAGTKEVTKIEKENLAQRQKDLDEAARKRKEAEEKARKEREEANKNADAVELEAFKETLGEREREEYEAGLKLAERRSALEKAGRTDTKLIEEAFRNEMADIKKKYDDKEAEEKKKKDEKDLEALRKKQEEERGIILTGLQAQFEALDRANKQTEFDFAQDLERLAQQKQLLAQQEATELQNLELTEFQRTEIRKKYADARMAITDQEIATEKAAAQAKHDINMAYLGLFEQFGGLLQQVAGKNKAIAIAGVIIQQAASIGQIIASTGIANAKAVAASPLTFGMPWVAINSVSAGLSIAASIAGAVKSIQQINQAAAQAGVKGSSGGTVSTSAPSIPTPRATGAAAPQINTGGGMNPTTAIAQTIGNAQQAPLKAYVISGEVSSQMALDRRTSRAATFTSG